MHYFRCHWWWLLFSLCIVSSGRKAARIVSKISTMYYGRRVQIRNVCISPNSQQFDECRLNFTRWFTYFLLHIEFQLKFCISQTTVVCHLLHILSNTQIYRHNLGKKACVHAAHYDHPKFIERVFWNFFC